MHTCVHMLVHIHVYTSARGGGVHVKAREPSLVSFFRHQAPFIFETGLSPAWSSPIRLHWLATGLSLAWSSPVRLHWLATDPPGPAFFCFLGTGLQACTMMPRPYVYTENHIQVLRLPWQALFWLGCLSNQDVRKYPSILISR